MVMEGKERGGRGSAPRWRQFVHARGGKQFKVCCRPQTHNTHTHTHTEFWVHSQVNIHLVLAQHVCPFLTFSASMFELGRTQSVSRTHSCGSIINLIVNM